VDGGTHEEILAKNDENIKCFGGVILTSEDGLIVCKNTLDSRIDLAYQHMLPSIRANLFM
jgi:V-type H+-transporting ATPase subunit E